VFYIESGYIVYVDNSIITSIFNQTHSPTPLLPYSPTPLLPYSQLYNNYSTGFYIIPPSGAVACAQRYIIF
ncbi:MAG: hypothetical protein SWX82_08015, partial [Cyanobacteriota bacterium]|nr:hypothetical protein [Cyanobacteriota bacterium]